MLSHDVTGRLSTALAGRYRVLRQLGEGGMAIVYLAEDVKHQREVALKLLRPELAPELGTERFLREIRLTAQLVHPNILPVLDSGEADGLLFYVMPLVRGATLRVRLERERQLPVDTAIRITEEVASALSHAHAHGILHRDVKPENILFADDHALLADFGIARPDAYLANDVKTVSGVALGTPAYMSPEQSAPDGSVDARSDLYALASVTYEMLAGEQPFTGPTAQAILVRRLTETPRPIRAARDTVSARVDAVIARALSRTPADRQQTVSQFASDLRAATSASPNVSARANMRWAVVGAVAASMLLVLFFRQQLGLSPSPALAPAIVRLAVLPLENLGAEGDAQFVDGMTDEIMSRLAEIGALKVVSRTSARSFRGASLSMREVGARLNADYVLEGTVRTDRAANGVTSARVTPRLVRVRDDAPLWTQSFDTALIPGELLRVQADIATRVADALNLKLGNHELRRVNRVMTRDSAAYRSYQLGRFQWQKRERESLERAADHFRDAVARDSQFADAYAGLSDAQGAYIALYGDTRAHDRQREASAAARRAVAIDSALAVGHASLGFCRFFLEWDWDGAETALRRSIALDAAYAPARYWLTQLLWLRGRYDEALEQARAAVLADPLSAVAYLARARSLRLLDREEEWVGDLRHAIELQPRLPVSWLDLAIYHARRGAPDSVRTASARFLEYRSESGRAPAGASDALTRALMGTASVAAFLRTVPSDSATDWSWLAVQLYAMRGESDSAFSKLRKLESSRGIDFPTTAPFLAGYLGGDARWRTVRKRLGL